MQIFQWLFKIADEHPQEPDSSHATKKQGVRHDERVRSRDIVVFNDQGSSKRYRKRVERQSKLKCSNLKLFYIFRRKDIAKACFYHSLNLKRLGSIRRRQRSTHPMKMKKQDIARGIGVTHKTDSSAHAGGNKVLPITDSTKLPSSNNNKIRPNDEKKEKSNGDKIKKVSKMKELLKWAANSKSEKGGNYVTRKFRNRVAIKAKPSDDDDDQLSNESPKISFRWDLESCSTTTSSAISMASSLKQEQLPLNVISLTSSTPLTIVDQYVTKTGNWITTDSEFVVLEL